MIEKLDVCRWGRKDAGAETGRSGIRGTLVLQQDWTDFFMLDARNITNEIEERASGLRRMIEGQTSQHQ